MSPIADWIFIIISILITYKSYRKLVFNRNASVAHYVILIVFIFCVLPIALNYLMGVPTYSIVYWYQPFLPAMNNVDVAIIYDILILISILVLYSYAIKADKKLERKAFKYDLLKENENTVLYVIGAISPFAFAVLTGNFSKLLIYNSMTGRGVDSTEAFILNSLILVSLYCNCILFLSGRIKKKNLFILAFFSVLLAWIQGKRFIIAVMAIFFLFFLTKSELGEKGRKRVFFALPIAGSILIAFCIFYLSVIKPLSDMSVSSVYDMLRVDFGRDDVIKFVIYREFFENKPILDYPGQSFFSTMFVYIPRFIWTSKPYSHYQYLTSAILSLPIDRLPAGTTPCWYEMCICNFGYIGVLLSIWMLKWFCYFADKMKQIKSKSLVFMLILVLLTQNTDVYMIYIFFIFVNYFMQRIKHPKIVFRKEKVKNATYR